MMRAPGRAGFTASPLIRLLARLSDAGAAEPRQALAERLSQWLGWTDAIALSAALDGHAAPPDGIAPRAGTEEAECRRVHGTLVQAIADGHGPAPDDFASCRRHYRTRQQAMAAGIGTLRERLRAALAGRSPALARLAAVDAVMERALGEREHDLLAAMPQLLERHFERLKQADEGTALDTFRQDMKDLLLAELALRWQPVDGLLEALRTQQPQISA